MRHIRTRINTKTKAAQAAQRVAGVSIQELKAALSGDKVCLQKLGSIHREGKLTATLMPLVTDIVNTKVKNEKDWNKFLGEFVAAGSNAESTIQLARSQSNLANTRYLHSTKELNEQHRGQKELEKGRHRYAINYNRAKLFVDALTQDVEGRIRIQEQGAKIRLKQMGEDLSHEAKVAQHLLEYGDAADISLIQKRDYAAEMNNPLRVFQRVKNALGI